MRKAGKLMSVEEFREEYWLREVEVSATQLLLTGKYNYVSELGFTDAWHMKHVKGLGYGRVTSYSRTQDCYGGFAEYSIVMERTEPVKMGERGQDTGLKDRNGRSVLVGDTIEFDEKEWGGPCRFEVKFEDGAIRVPGTLDDARSWWTVVDS